VEPRHPSVGLGDDRQRRGGREPLHEREHLLGTEPAVHANRRRAERLEDDRGGLRVGSRELGAPGHAVGQRDEHGDVGDGLRGEQRRTGLGQVRERLEEYGVRRLGGQSADLLGEDLEDLVVGGRPERRHREAGGPDVGQDVLGPGLTRDAHGGTVEFDHLVADAPLRELGPRAAERVRGEGHRPALDVADVDLGDHLRRGHVEQLGRLAGRKAHAAQERSHGAVDDDDLACGSLQDVRHVLRLLYVVNHSAVRSTARDLRTRA
jgi:hypothetical protein